MKFLNKFFVLMLASFFTFAIAGSAQAAATLTVNLGTAANYAILAYSGITNTGATTISGDVGSSATPTQTGFETVTFTSGANHVAADPNDDETVAAKVALTTAYTDAAGRTGAIPIAGGDLGGRTLTAGVYTDNNDPDALALTGTLTLDAQGDTNAVWIFQSGSTLTTASGSKVVLINGAQSCNIFWQVTSSATIGTTSTFVGNILALSSITLNTGATIDGRALARNGLVTLAANTITASTCTAASVEATAAAAYTAAQAAATAAQAAAATAATPALPATGNGANDNSTFGYILLSFLVVSLTIISTAVIMKRKATSMR